jgi:isoleucyl-tRNA synthetase
MDKVTSLPVFATPNFHLLTEAEIAEAWQQNDIYAQLNRRAASARYILREMPSAVHDFKLDTFRCKIHQDVFLKVNMMQGKGVVYVPQWNYYTPVVERHVLNSTQEDDILDSLRFRRQCRREFQRALAQHQQQLHALGIFGEWEGTSKNLAPRCEAKIINAFGKVRELGHLNKDQKLGYWCQKCHTSLSEDEIENRPFQTYSGYVKFPVSIGLEEFGEDVYFAVWVQDLWHLAGSVALGLKGNSQYLITEVNGEVLVFTAKEITIDSSIEHQQDIRVLKTGTVDTLTDCTCAHPFLSLELSVVSVPDLPVDADLPPLSEQSSLIHLASGHHPCDYRIAQALGLPILSVISDAGCLTDDAEQFCGLNAFEAGKFIAFELEKRGYLIRTKHQNISHPHCWTCGTPVLFRPVQQWIFPSNDDHLKHRVLHSDEYWTNYSQADTEWIKQAIRELLDLPVSCERGWGIPIPVFQCGRCGHQLSDARIIKAIRELISRRGTGVWFKLGVEDLLPPDTVCPNCGTKEFQKESTFLDSRFAVLLNAINHSDAKKNKSELMNVYFFVPDRFRKWFAQLVLTSIAIYDTVPFQKLELIQIGSNIQSVEISESWLDKYPKDVLRILGIHPDFDRSSADALIHQCKETYKGIQILFRSMLSVLSDLNPREHKLPLDNLLPLDALALSVTNEVLQSVDLAYQQHRFHQAWSILSDFCESDLYRFYLPMLEERVKAPEGLLEKRSGQTALWEILHVLIQRFAPITPFLAEQIHTLIQEQSVDVSPSTGVSLNGDSDFSSVFLQDWIPQINISPIADANARWKERCSEEASIMATRS